MSEESGLAPAWIVVIVLSVLLAAETMYIIMQLSNGRFRGGMPMRTGRPRTEWYDLRSHGDDRVHGRQTGFSPIEPPRARFRY